MSTKISIRVADHVCGGELYDDRAPLTVQALLERLPIVDRTIQTRWSGDAWRTEQNHVLRPQGSDVENVADRLGPGDIIYYPGWHANNIKIGIAYGQARWLAPFMKPLDVSLIGRITEGLDGFVAACQQIIFTGPLDVEIRPQN